MNDDEVTAEMAVKMFAAEDLPGSSELWDVAVALYKNDRKYNPQFVPWNQLVSRTGDNDAQISAAARRSMLGYLDEARAAIEALRQPSSAMIHVGRSLGPEAAAEVVWGVMMHQVLR